MLLTPFKELKNLVILLFLSYGGSSFSSKVALIEVKHGTVLDQELKSIRVLSLDCDMENSVTKQIFGSSISLVGKKYLYTFHVLATCSYSKHDGSIARVLLYELTLHHEVLNFLSREVNVDLREL